MKQIHFSALGCFLLCATFLPSALGNHRTGTLILPEVMAAGDLNEDGNLDIAVNASGFDVVALLFGDGQGRFTLNGHLASDTLPKGLAIGDMDRDGHLDLVQCNNWGYDAVLHFGDGLGGFGERDVVVNGEGGPNRVVVADFNNDRSLDMAVAGPDEGVILIYLGNGKGEFTLPPKEIEDVGNGREIITADFNADGNMDIAAARTSGVGVFLGDGTGSFTLSAQLTNNRAPAALASGDLNNDGKLDLVVGGAGPESDTNNFISTYLGDGAGSFVPKQTLDLGPGNLKGEIAVGDFNEDGNPDVAFPQNGSSGILPLAGNAALIFFGDGTGSMLAGPVLTVGKAPHSVIAADFNKDAHLDLAVSNRTDGTVSVLLGDGSGNFALSATVSVLCPTCLPEG